jgi:SAM-dependent methyltransferase
MTVVASRGARVLEQHARQSLGSSEAALYAMVAAALAERGARGSRLVDVGCGGGHLWPYLRDRFSGYLGIDAVPYPEFPGDGEFVEVDLDRAPLPLAAESADAVVAVETIEHLENPRAFVRELVRLAKPGAWIGITTPNQRSLLSLLTLICRGRFSAFQDAHYPAHITALLDVDLRRIGTEVGLVDAAIVYSLRGRMPLAAWHYPHAVAAVWPSALSDNLLLIARKPPNQGRS